ncbi:SRPBCC domain-containing protein [Nocardioides sp.]|uniref:SRPBCC domain-containing protein n=1 Tax=Nocardioides sp. TaxID=35761 RepID=UPI003569F028
MTHPRASIKIDAPLETVWAVMLDIDSYGEWNPFLFRAETASPPAVGNPIVLHVRWPNGKTTRSPERITAIDAPTTENGVTTACLSYVYAGLPSKLRMLSATRHQRLRQEPGGPTIYDTVEEFAGPFVRFAGPDRVTDGFEKHAAGLKKRAEELAGRTSGPS